MGVRPAVQVFVYGWDNLRYNSPEKIAAGWEEHSMVYYHLPGLFEFYEFYRVFLPLFRTHREYFYDWCDIGSIYGAPADCLWGGGRVGFGEADPRRVLELTQSYGISARLTLSNSLLRQEHLTDRKCNQLCRLFSKSGKNGVILHSDLLLNYLKDAYPGLYFVSSTTKVLTDFRQLEEELNRALLRCGGSPETGAALLKDPAVQKRYAAAEEMLAGLAMANPYRAIAAAAPMEKDRAGYTALLETLAELLANPALREMYNLPGRAAAGCRAQIAPLLQMCERNAHLPLVTALLTERCRR